METSPIMNLRVALANAREALQWCDEYFTARDQMNAKIHCAPLRLSPITERVKKAIEVMDRRNAQAGFLDDVPPVF